ncbi:hypothetical protein BH10PAT3_BH10PAT3_6530 [soil metagenome]
MSRSYAFKPELKKQSVRSKPDRRVVLADYEIEFIEEILGPTIRLQFQ